MLYGPLVSTMPVRTHAAGRAGLPDEAGEVTDAEEAERQVLAAREDEDGDGRRKDCNVRSQLLSCSEGACRGSATNPGRNTRFFSSGNILMGEEPP